jgi:hypothetical protein
MDYVRKTATLGNITGLPKQIPDLKYPCPLCKIAAAPKLPRGGPTDSTELRKGDRIHADWIIMNQESVRGFKTALLFTEVRSRRKWGFPTRSRSAPIEQLKFFVNHMRRHGYRALELRIDEDGSLANSTNFMRVCTEDLHLAIQTTGGYNSENNGMVESPIKPIKRMVRLFLIGAGMSDELWCFAFTYAVYVHNHRYNRMIDTLPIVKWNDGNYEFQSKDLLIFGSKMYIITKAEYKKQLQTRTEKDPRDYIGLTISDDELPDHVDGFFVGYASHSTVLLAWDPESRRIKRTHHCYVDEYNVRTNPDEKLSLNSVLLQDLPPAVINGKGILQPRQIKLVSSTLHETTDKLDPDLCASIVVELPRRDISLGISFKSDERYGFPLLVKVDPHSPLRTQIPMDMQRNCWLVSINTKENGFVEPITAKFCLDELKRCQSPDHEVTAELTFHRKIKPIATDLQTLRMMSDQATPSQPIVRHIASLPERPVSSKTIFDNLKGPHRHHWIQGLKHQYSKNASMLVLSQPVPRAKLPKDTKVYRSVIAPRIKEKGKDLYKFEARHCLDGQNMVQGKDFDFSFSPTISYPGMRIVLAFCAVLNLTSAILDVENCFQNDAIKPEQRLFVTAPPLYIQWFKETYPDIKLEQAPDGKYVLQTINGMQGRKDAGRNWYLLLKEILEDFGFKYCPAEPALFVYYEGEETMYVVTSTDDFLVCYSTPTLYSMLQVHMKKFVPITTQEGQVMKYLNVRIVQSDMGISIDQTHHIQTTILDKWFPSHKTEQLKTADTPYRTDSEFEKQLNSQLPAKDADLQALETEFGGKYNTLIGQFLHIAQVTRFDIGFSCARFSQYNVAPNKAAFQGLKRMARYLATHLHTPIFYPRQKLTMYQTIRFEYEPGKWDTHIILNLLQEFVDSDHARDTKSRKSMSCILAAICGVAVHWHMGKQSCIAGHSTDAEIRAYFTAMMINKYLRVILDYLKKPLPGPTVIWEDNQPAIDIMKAGQITGRVKHMAVPIAMIQEDIKHGNSEPRKIKGTLNPADIGTKPLPCTSLHRHFRQMRGQHLYPPPTSEHGKLMQVELVNQRLTDFDSAAPSKIDYHSIRGMTAVYDNKEKNIPNK